MFSFRLRSLAETHRVFLAVAVSVALLLTGVAFGDGAPVFYSGGKAHSLIRSDTEFVVEMAPGTEADVRAKLAGDSSCTVHDIPWAVHTRRFCVVEVRQTDFAARLRLRAETGAQAVRPVYRFENSSSPLFSSGQLVVRLKGSLTQGQRDEFFSDFKTEIVRVIDPELYVYIARPVGDPHHDEVRAAAAMYRDDRTRLAHPDFIIERETRQILEQVEDPLFERQWHLNNTGQGLGTIGADINVAEAWASTFGEDVRLGIYDDAVDVSHEDLSPNYTAFGHESSSGDEGAFVPNPVNSFDRHGTAVMGLAVADGNMLGGRGVAPAARFTASRGLADAPTLGQDASVYAFARQRDVDVHINSWGFPNATNSQVDIVVDAINTVHALGRNGRGMVVVFASGNSALELDSNDDLATLSSVIGIGASNAEDRLASYSNYGRDIDMLAPSGDAFLPGMLSTDVTDSSGFANFGYNDGGGQDIFGVSDVSNPRYTQNFSGTSASCPVAAGVAALVVSSNQDLTAEQVRTVLAQTCDKVDSLAAGYHPVTEFSLTHGYGRINAGRAVTAAVESSGSGFTWPEPVRSARISGGQLIWTVGDVIRMVDDDDNSDTPASEFGDRTIQTLLIESDLPFTSTNTFIPEDGVDYSVGEVVAPGMTVVQKNSDTNFDLGDLSGTRYYSLFPINALGRFAFGVTVDTEGNTEGVGGSSGGGGDGGDGGTGGPAKPQVSIRVTPLSGPSPLEVQCRGNALSEAGIDSREWDFDDGTASSEAITTHRYEIIGGQSQRFFPTFTVTDVNGVTGSRSVAVDVIGESGGSESDVEGDIQIVIQLPSSVGSDVDRGVSPFRVELSVAGTAFEGEIQSVSWDLGNGNTASTISVPQTYTNLTDSPITLPISVAIVTLTTDQELVTQTATRFITIDPDPSRTSSGNTDSSSQGTTGQLVPGGLPPMCGAGATIAMFTIILLAFGRRRFHQRQ